MEAEYCGDGIMGLLANNSLSGSDKKLLNPELLNPADPDSPELILHGFSFVGGEEYYLKIGNEFRVYALSENRQISSWAIDTDEAGPLFTFELDRGFGEGEILRIGFMSRGIKMLGSDDFDFPKVCVEYQQDDQGQFVISNRMEEPFKSLYTGNKVGIRKRLSGYSYEARLLITLGQKDSIQEHMSCPCVIRQGLIEATRDVFSTIRDINMPFLNWQRDLGFIFLRSLSSEE